MASSSDEETSPEPLQKQDHRSDEQNCQRSIDNQQERALKESSRILKDITGNAKGFPSRSHIQWWRNKRLPRLYYINNDQTILIILQGDITKTKVDAIVNAANQHMTGGSGVDGIIHRAAGDKLYDACVAHKEITPHVRLPTGHSRILLSYNMSPTTYYIINTAGPVYSRHAAEQCAEKLSSCYKTALALANLYDLESIGFTAISCGIFGYPANDGAKVALQTVDKEADSVPVVVFVLWDDHIYDAWVNKADELKFTPFDPECVPTANSSKPSIDNDQVKSNENAGANNNEQDSSTTFNLTCRDFSTETGTTKSPEDNMEHLLKSLPSVPNESSDTQHIDHMKQDNNSTDANDQLATQETVEKTNVNPEEEKSTTNDHSEQQLAQEETDKSNDEKAKIETVEEKESRSVVTDSSGDQD